MEKSKIIIFKQSLLTSVEEKYNGEQSQGNENLADSWYNSVEYQELSAFRREGTDTISIFKVKGPVSYTHRRCRRRG